MLIYDSLINYNYLSFIIINSYSQDVVNDNYEA